MLQRNKSHRKKLVFIFTVKRLSRQQNILISKRLFSSWHLCFLNVYSYLHLELTELKKQILFKRSFYVCSFKRPKNHQ